MNKVYGLILTALLLGACGGGDSEKAASVLENARVAMNSDDFDYARSLIDSLRSSYPREVEMRRQALLLADSIELKEALLQSIKADSVVTFKQFEVEDIKRDFVFEKNEKYQTTGYFVTKEYAGSKSRFSCFPEVEEGGALLLVSVDRTKGIVYHFDKIEVDLANDIIPSSNVQDMTAQEAKAYESCYKLARCMRQLDDAKSQSEKYKMKVRFYEKKLNERAFSK